MASKNKRRANALKSVEQFDEYCVEDLDSEKKDDTIESNYKRKQNSDNHIEGDECLPNPKKQLPIFNVNSKSKTASKTKFQKDIHTDKNQFLDECGKQFKGPVKNFLDEFSENTELSNNPEYHSSILNPNYKPVDTGLFFYATLPGECYFEYFDESQFPEKKFYNIKNNSKREKFSDNHLEEDECLPNPKKQLPIFNINFSGTASKTKFQNDVHTNKNQYYDEHSKKSQYPLKHLSDKFSEIVELSDNPECQSLILKQNSKSVDTGLSFYDTIPGECYF